MTRHLFQPRRATRRYEIDTAHLCDRMRRDVGLAPRSDMPLLRHVQM